VHAKISAIVLAAGTSSRMGEVNKLLLPWGPSTICATVLEAIAKVEFFENIVVTNRSTLKELVIPEGFQVVINDDYQTGLTSSIQQGVASCDLESDAYMICLGDQPLIGVDTYKEIKKVFYKALAINHKSIVAPFFDDRRGNPIIFSSHYRKEILAYAQAEGCKGLIESNKQHLVKCGVSDRAILKDIDTMSDYREIKNQYPDI
jgi:molybdenum cofactor cytidylyltransferase